MPRLRTSTGGHISDPPSPVATALAPWGLVKLGSAGSGGVGGCPRFFKSEKQVLYTQRIFPFAFLPVPSSKRPPPGDCGLLVTLACTPLSSWAPVRI